MLSFEGLIAILWLAFAVSTLLSIGRLVVRARFFRRFYPDDYLHASAVAFSLVFSILSTLYQPVAGLTSWQNVPESLSLEANRRRHPYAIMVGILFWLTIYAAKFSFLAFYYRLFGVSRQFRVVAAIVTVFSFVSFCITIGLSIWFCRPPVEPWDIAGCDLMYAWKVSGYPSLWTPAALHLASELAIILLPLWQLNRLRLQRSEKVGAALLFLIAAVGMVMDIIRVVLTNLKPGSGSTSSVSGYAVCDVLEPFVAVIISALIAYAPLIRRPETRRSPTRDVSTSMLSTTQMLATDGDRGDNVGDDACYGEEAEDQSPIAQAGQQQPRSILTATLHDDMEHITSASPVERKFYRLRLLFLERESKGQKDDGTSDSVDEKQGQQLHSPV